MELGGTSSGDLRSGGMILHISKVRHVTTVNHVAKLLGVDEDWLSDVASEMEIEDGVVWVYGIGEDGILAFTDLGIENLRDLIKMPKENPDLLKRPG
jgi:hypothetical protein